MAQVITPTKKFTRSSTGVTETDGTAAVLSNIWVVQIQKGLGVVIPGSFRFIFKCLDAAATEMPATTEIYFGYMTPDDTRRVQPIGSMMLYQPWRDLTTAQQQDEDYARVITVNFGGIGLLPLIEDESFVLQAYGPTGTVDASESEFYLPYAERSPEDLVNELKLRRQYWGK